MFSALVFNKLFFPASSPEIGTLLALSTFAIGFIARPLGGYVLGRLGDRIGRKPVLVLTLMIIGITTALMGCLPTYETVGLWAPIALLALRLIQGFALGGEYGGAVILVTEFAGTKYRGWWAARPGAGGPAGVLLATGTLTILSALTTPEQFLSLGWRVPFFFSIVLTLGPELTNGASGTHKETKQELACPKPKQIRPSDHSCPQSIRGRVTETN